MISQKSISDSQTVVQTIGGPWSGLQVNWKKKQTDFFWIIIDKISPNIKSIDWIIYS